MWPQFLLGRRGDFFQVWIVGGTFYLFDLEKRWYVEINFDYTLKRNIIYIQIFPLCCSTKTVKIYYDLLQQKWCKLSFLLPEKGWCQYECLMKNSEKILKTSFIPKWKDNNWLFGAKRCWQLAFIYYLWSFLYTEELKISWYFLGHLFMTIHTIIYIFIYIYLIRLLTTRMPPLHLHTAISLSKIIMVIIVV